MRTFFTLFVSIVFSITLIGCVTQTKQPIRQELSDTIIKNVANDAAAFLAHQFPAAKTRFNITLSNEEKDNFSKTLVKNLRLKGFEIQENAQNSIYNNTNFSIKKNEMFYVLRINIDNSKYSKCYSLTNGKPVSSWSVIKQ